MVRRQSWWRRWSGREWAGRSDRQPATGPALPGTAAGFDFDELARDMARGLSRREALRRLGGGLGGALLASLGLGVLRPAPAEATTPANLAICLADCNQAASSCAQVCSQTAQAALASIQQTYQSCVSHCAPGAVYLRCLAACQATRTQQVQLVLQQEAQCFRGCSLSRLACGNGCSLNGDAVVGFCSALPVPLQSACISSGALGGGLYGACQGDPARLCQHAGDKALCCPSGTVCCSSTCVDPQADALNCGGCGNICPAGVACVNGRCDCPHDTLTCGTGSNVVCCATNQGGPSGYPFGVCQNGACVPCPNGLNGCGTQCCAAGAFCTQDLGPLACVCADDVELGGPKLPCGGTTLSGVQINPTACCLPGTQICQSGGCVTCGDGQTACIDRCCPRHSLCSYTGSLQDPSLKGTCTCDSDHFACMVGSQLTACCAKGTEQCLNGLCMGLVNNG